MLSFQRGSTLPRCYFYEEGRVRMIGVLDYGIGNIGSILNMLKKAGAEAQPVKGFCGGCDRLDFRF